VKFPNSIFNGNPFSGSGDIKCGQTNVAALTDVVSQVFILNKPNKGKFRLAALQIWLPLL
jgi:hypothetical protein